MMSDPHDPDAAPEPRDEFWGEQSEWTPQTRSSSERQGVAAVIGRWWDGLLGGGAGGASRVHGQPGAGAHHGDIEHSSADTDDYTDGHTDERGRSNPNHIQTVAQGSTPSSSVSASSW